MGDGAIEGRLNHESAGQGSRGRGEGMAGLNTGRREEEEGRGCCEKRECVHTAGEEGWKAEGERSSWRSRHWTSQ